jgi:hypothetical protein
LSIIALARNPSRGPVWHPSFHPVLNPPESICSSATLKTDLPLLKRGARTKVLRASENPAAAAAVQ